MALGQPLEQHRRAIGIFPSREQAEHALGELRDSGFPMDKVSVVAKDSNHNDERLAGTEVTHQVGNKVGNKADEGAKTGAITGGALGGLAGLLVGLGILAIPGIGPVMLAGAGATVLATALSGTAIGAATGGLLGGLVGLGIPEDRAKVYSDRVAQGQYMVIVEGTDADLRRAEAILQHRGVEEWGIYDTQHSGGAGSTAIAEPSVKSPEIANSAATVATVEPENIQSIDLYSERLVPDKTRQKTGEVSVGKHVAVETQSVSTSIERERVIVERIKIEDADRPVALDETSFRAGEIFRMAVYEETPNIQKEVFVREEVSLRKEVTREVVSLEDTVRREEIRVETEGHPAVNADRDRLPQDRI
ncbi:MULTISPECIES: YsnF/AvaK domain-containing protein [Trichocoleus]|uniref:YsnF/AvaK domain-containing protein n=1 Tax=Trichocoleus desertorum GB2-A4 TaxID=2933944 RepID=A0ABV0JAV6_9CYAN|nr:YsnF/AvaK domain-containing protein [Trichocoleus sp. FACHB-46]MBD1863158.1 YsnF/AvaK domain-containing protein [Trichocoleus sp. FACHB-46]